MMRLASIHPQIQALLAGCFLKGVQCTPVTDITHTGHSAKQVPVEENHNIALRIPQSLESLGMSQPKYPKEHISYILNPLKNTGFTRRAEIPNSQQEGQSWIRLIKEEFQALKSETYEFLRLCSCVPSRNKRTPELIGIIDIIALLKDSRLAILKGKEITIEIPKLDQNMCDIFGHRKFQDTSGEWIHDSFKKFNENYIPGSNQQNLEKKNQNFKISQKSGVNSGKKSNPSCICNHSDPLENKTSPRDADSPELTAYLIKEENLQDASENMILNSVYGMVLLSTRNLDDIQNIFNSWFSSQARELYEKVLTPKQQRMFDFFGIKWPYITYSRYSEKSWIQDL
ncbi:hypothetical protein PGT21_014991 [Puccinia graminis f. sp. tritici]|uniref:Uncharacterized protein n=1 Tax=Puccinia graminis f. sp. tritici TaxID=56615 RepID=A0A5B0PTZ3_PUCGR|nr:hypothetical protein PGT21_014991 [Puccinia graminis f. sp. tritici]